MRSVAWSGRRIGLLKKLWAEGMTATDIATQLRISRAAVLGKVFRLRLGPAGGAKSSKTKPRAASVGWRHRGRRYAETQIASVAPATARGKSLFELTNVTCRWLGFLDAFRTICIDPKEEIRATFEAMRNSWILV
jgi:hypothetical protein